ncbi:DUF4145 domain-containing protein [Rodentibacter ratti]|uniref:DUF4145 domain-containing protein n=1 Tax=Rodentibacter ratti TaxID=1906745 RepID=A0A1V3L559_9PAST|nr:DUF4145 domain-containing protein [Rodentibacter ratti]OOF85094.1 hypothetical protein BKG88_09010 [Rodentibacter ratti]
MITFGHDCPYCKKKNVAFEVADFARRERNNHNTDVFAILGTCNNCGGGVVTNVLASNNPPSFGYSSSQSDITNNTIENHHRNKYSLEEIFPNQKFVFYPLPSKPEIPEYLPPDLENAFSEAEDLFCLVEENKFLKQAGSSYRAVIELALSKLDDNPADKNLNQRINQLADKGKLSPSMKDFAHRIRTLGNGASHALLEFSKQDLDDIRLFTRLFLTYSFTLPAMIPAVEKQD